ncbi:MAG: radical SAM protein [Desulfurococcaceae archaeon]
MGLISDILREKKEVIERIRRTLGPDEISRALRDHHSKRRPRPCGITIHTGIGCSYGCTYCYIYDMGFPGKVTPYPLKPAEMAFAIATNPYVLPRMVFAAYGSVTEPFLEETRDLSIQYIGEVYKWLKLPSQVATKSVLNDLLASELKNTDPMLNVLITIITIERYAELEPCAPSPLDRIEGGSIAADKKLNVTLFVRPIIPGITNKEIDKVLSIAIEKGIDTVVFGSLRVTHGILRRLKAKLGNIVDIEKRLDKMPRSSTQQVPIKAMDIKKKLVKTAIDYGFKVFETACSANVNAHREFCNACGYGPCGDPSKKPRFSSNDVLEYLEHFNISAKDMEIDEDHVRLYILPRNHVDRVLDIVKYHLSFSTRLRVRLHLTK